MILILACNATGSSNAVVQLDHDVIFYLRFLIDFHDVFLER